MMFVDLCIKKIRVQNAPVDLFILEVDLGVFLDGSATMNTQKDEHNTRV